MESKLRKILLKLSTVDDEREFENIVKQTLVRVINILGNTTSEASLSSNNSASTTGATIANTSSINVSSSASGEGQRSLALEILNHISKRAPSFNSCVLPIEDLLDAISSSEAVDPETSNRRALTSLELNLLLSYVKVGHAKVNDATRLITLWKKMVSICTNNMISNSDISSKIQLTLTPLVIDFIMIKSIKDMAFDHNASISIGLKQDEIAWLLDVAIDVMLFRPAPSGLPQGLSQSRYDRVKPTTSNDPSLSVSSYAADRQKDILHFIVKNQYLLGINDEDVYIFLNVAFAEAPRHDSASLAEDALKRIKNTQRSGPQKGIDYENIVFIKKTVDLVSGQDKSRLSLLLPINSRASLIRSVLVKSKIIAEDPSISMISLKIITDSLFQSMNDDIQGKLAESALDLSSWMLSKENSKGPKHAGIILCAALRKYYFVIIDGESNQAQSQIKRSKNVISNLLSSLASGISRYPSAFTQDIGLFESLMKNMSTCELETQSSFMNPIVSLCDSFSQSNDTIKNQIIDFLFKVAFEEADSGSSTNEHFYRRKLVAAEYARKIFPFKHIQSKYILLALSSEKYPAVRASAKLGLDPSQSKSIRDEDSSSSILSQDRSKTSDGKILSSDSFPILYSEYPNLEDILPGIDSLPLTLQQKFQFMSFLRLCLMSEMIRWLKSTRNRSISSHDIEKFLLLSGDNTKDTIVSFLGHYQRNSSAEEQDSIKKYAGMISRVVGFEGHIDRIKVVDKGFFSMFVEIVSAAPDLFKESMKTFGRSWISVHLTQAEDEAIRSNIASLYSYIPMWLENPTEINETVNLMRRKIEESSGTPTATLHGSVLGAGYLLGALSESHESTHMLAQSLLKGAEVIRDKRYFSFYVESISRMKQTMNVHVSSQQVIEILIPSVEKVLWSDEKDNRLENEIVLKIIDVLDSICHSSLRVNEVEICKKVIEIYIKMGTREYEEETHFHIGRSLFSVYNNGYREKTEKVEALDIPSRTLSIIINGRFQKERIAAGIWGLCALFEIEPENIKEISQILPQMSDAFISLLSERSKLAQEIGAMAFGLIHLKIATVNVPNDAMLKSAFRKFVTGVRNNTGRDHSTSANNSSSSSNTENSGRSSNSSKNDDGMSPDSFKLIAHAFSEHHRQMLPLIFTLGCNDGFWQTTTGKPFYLLARSMSQDAVSNSYVNMSNDKESRFAELVSRLFLMSKDSSIFINKSCSIILSLYSECYKKSSLAVSISEKEISNLVVRNYTVVMDDIMESLSKPIARLRQLACASLGNLIQTLQLESVSGSQFEHSYLEYFLSIWEDMWTKCMRVYDDLNDQVQAEAATLSKGPLFKLTLRMCNELSSSSIDIVFPYLLRKGIVDAADKVRDLSLKLLVEIITTDVATAERDLEDKKKDSVIDTAILHGTYLSEAVSALLESISSMEDGLLQYAQFHTQDNQGDLQVSSNQLESIRVQVAQSSVMMKAVKNCIQKLLSKSLNQEIKIRIADDLIPRLVSLLRSGVGLPTLVCTVSVLAEMVSDKDFIISNENIISTTKDQQSPSKSKRDKNEIHIMARYADSILSAVARKLNDPSSTLRKHCSSLGAACAPICKPSHVSKYVDLLADLYGVHKGADGVGRDDGSSAAGTGTSVSASSISTIDGNREKRLASAQACNDLVNSISSSVQSLAHSESIEEENNQGNYLIKLAQLSFLSRFDEDPTISKIYTEVWKETQSILSQTGVSQTEWVKQLASRCLDAITNELSWRSRREGSLGLFELVNPQSSLSINSRTALGDTWIRNIRTSIAAALPGQLWDGKEVLLSVYAFTAGDEGENIDELSREAIAVFSKECVRSKRMYRKASYDAIKRFIITYPRSVQTEQNLNSIYQVCVSSLKDSANDWEDKSNPDPIVLSSAYSCLSQACDAYPSSKEISSSLLSNIYAFVCSGLSQGMLWNVQLEALQLVTSLSSILGAKPNSELLGESKLTILFGDYVLRVIHESKKPQVIVAGLIAVDRLVNVVNEISPRIISMIVERIEQDGLALHKEPRIVEISSRILRLTKQYQEQQQQEKTSEESSGDI